MRVEEERKSVCGTLLDQDDKLSNDDHGNTRILAKETERSAENKLDKGEERTHKPYINKRASLRPLRERNRPEDLVLQHKRRGKHTDRSPSQQ